MPTAVPNRKYKVHLESQHAAAEPVLLFQTLQQLC